MNDIIFHYSAIDTAYQCLEKYRLRHIEQIPMEVESGDMHFGTAMHLAMSAYFEGLDPESVFLRYWDSIVNKELRYTVFDWAKLRDKGLVFISRWVRLHAKKYEPFKVEERMKIKLNGFNVEGTADFIGLYEGIPSIVDFKAYLKILDKTKIITNEQMYLYAHMSKEFFGYEIKQIAYVGFVKLEDRIQTNLKIELTPAKTKSMLDNVTLMMRDLSTRKEFPKNRNSCQYCEYFNRCYS